ncbi:YchJ family protein [Dermacoccaceae bacterium W4C1]
MSEPLSPAGAADPGVGSDGAPPVELCPCDSGVALAECCLPLLTTERLAETALELMRSRYTAYTFGHREHLWRTWHPRTRPAQVDLDRAITWTGLSVHEVIDGGPDDDGGIVDFTASYEGGELHERSVFARRAGRWFYLDAEEDVAD